MDILSSTQLTVPMVQIVMLLGFSTMALIFGRMKLALLINYCFTLYWGYIPQLSFLTESGQFNKFTFAYFGFGLLVVLLAIVGFMHHSD